MHNIHVFARNNNTCLLIVLTHCSVKCLHRWKLIKLAQGQSSMDGRFAGKGSYRHIVQLTISRNNWNFQVFQEIASIHCHFVKCLCMYINRTKNLYLTSTNQYATTKTWKYNDINFNAKNAPKVKLSSNRKKGSTMMRLHDVKALNGKFLKSLYFIKGL